MTRLFGETVIHADASVSKGGLGDAGWASIAKEHRSHENFMATVRPRVRGH